MFDSYKLLWIAQILVPSIAIFVVLKSALRRRRLSARTIFAHVGHGGYNGYKSTMSDACKLIWIARILVPYRRLVDCAMCFPNMHHISQHILSHA